MTGRHRGRRHGRGGNGADRAPLPIEPVADVITGAAEPIPDEVPGAVAIAVHLDADGAKASCTAAQMRRFIKSRPYVPLHELRRRFGIEGDEDEVSSFEIADGALYVGLPSPEAQLLGELVRSGEVGYELLLDPTCPAIIGVFPMRPVARG